MGDRIRVRGNGEEIKMDVMDKNGDVENNERLKRIEGEKFRVIEGSDIDEIVEFVGGKEGGSPEMVKFKGAVYCRIDGKH